MEDTPAIGAVIGYTILLAKFVEREDISDAAGVEIYGSSTEVGFLRRVEGTLVAVDPNRVLRRTNVGDMFRVRKQMNR